MLTVIHQHVVRLQVQMNHPTAVEVVDGTQDLEQQLSNMRLCVQISEESERVWKSVSISLKNVLLKKEKKKRNEMRTPRKITVLLCQNKFFVVTIITSCFILKLRSFPVSGNLPFLFVHPLIVYTCSRYFA